LKDMLYVVLSIVVLLSLVALFSPLDN